ncbi:MAG: hypothetical protein EA362_11440 [Saprospirales bacterium]|nr:MAG: hypothetical protein EA362_11440 [Saprospirales bacterium]
MNCKFKGFLFICFFLFGNFLSAQNFEVGIGLGPTAYNGDLSVHTGKDIFGNMGINGTLFGNYYIHPFVNVGLSLSYGQISGSDRYAEDDLIKRRNLSFQSNVTEVALRVEFNLTRFEPYNFRSPASPYLFGGIGWFWFDPKAEYQGNLVRLQPLGTEGQGLDSPWETGEPYQLNGMVIPFGIGFKYALSEMLTIAFEVGYRYTFTDYLDDVSGNYFPYSILLEERGQAAAELSDRRWELVDTPPQNMRGSRGSRDGNDGYVFAVFKVSYHFLDTGLGQSRTRRSNRSGCYSF